MSWEALLKRARGHLASSHLQGVPISAHLLAPAVAACAKARQWQLALQLHLEAPGEGLEAVLESTCLCSQWRITLELYQGGVGDFWALRACRAWPQALALLSRMRPAAGCYNLVLGMLPWPRAISLLEAMDSINGASYVQVISSCGRASQWAWAWEVYQRMRRRLGDVKAGVNAMISACEKGRQWQRALDIFQQLRDPDVISFSSCISALEKGNQWQRAGILIYEMLQHGPEPNIITFNSYISACTGQWPTCLNCLRQMPSYGMAPDDYSLVAGMSGVPWRPGLHLLSTSRSQSTECTEAFSALLTTWRPWRKCMALLMLMGAATLEVSQAASRGLLQSFKDASRWVSSLS